MPYRSILLPVDVAHPETAPAMFEKARALLSDGGTLRVVYVVPDIPAYVVAEMDDGVMPGALGKSEQVLRGLVAEAGMKAEVEILAGQAPRAIIAAAETQGADLIIVSSHRPGLADYLLGSTAARIVRHAQCSVLVIR